MSAEMQVEETKVRPARLVNGAAHGAGEFVCKVKGCGKPFMTARSLHAHTTVAHMSPRARRLWLERRADTLDRKRRQKRTQAARDAKRAGAQALEAQDPRPRRGRPLKAPRLATMQPVASLADAIAYLETKRDWINGLIAELRGFHHT